MFPEAVFPGLTTMEGDPRQLQAPAPRIKLADFALSVSN